MPRKRLPGYKPPVMPQSALRETLRIVPPPQREAMDEEEAAPKRRAKGIDDDTFQGIVRNAIQSGKNYDLEQLRDERLRGWRYYKGEMDEDLPPNENGSTVVSLDVRDMVHAVLPSIERIFCESDNVVEFEPETQSDEAWAGLATNYVNRIVLNKLGRVGLRNVFLDAFMGKVGVVKWWWDDAERVRTEQYFGLSQAAFELATEAPDKKTTVEVIERTERTDPPDPMMVEIVRAARAAGQQVPDPPPVPVIDCIIRYTTTTRQLCIEPVAPEERIIAPRARSAEQAPFRGHWTVKPVHELVAMGYDREEILEYATTDVDTDPNLSEDEAARQPSGYSTISEDIADEDYRLVEYCELWIQADRDGDGVAELLKVCTLGDEFHVVHEEPADQVQMAEFQVMPMPHTATGRSLADNTTDIQRIKTGLWRGVMESLPHSIYPRYAAVENQVNYNHLLNPSPGAPIRIRQPNAVTPFTVPFVGAEAMNVMTYVDENIRDQRTGISKAAQGLDPDALQSTPKEAAAAMVGATQSQLEGYARMLGETGFRQLYRGLLREIVMNQRDPEFIKINEKWVEVDPRPWNAELNVRIDVSGGTHNAAQKLVALAQIAQAQAAAMQQLGPDNPLVGLAEIYNVQADIARLSGFRNVGRFWKDPASMPGWKPQPPPGQADPNAAAQAIAQADVEKERIKDDTKRYELQLNDDRERDKNEANTIIEALKIGMNPEPIIQLMRMPRPPSTLPAPPNPHNPPNLPQLPNLSGQVAGSS